jgi:sortase A
MRNILKRVGWAMISLGAFTLYFLVYQLVGTNAITARAQDELAKELTQQWSAAGRQQTGRQIKTEPTPTPGKPFAVIEIPRLELEKYVIHGHEREGLDLERLEKLEKADLRLGPTHIATTKLPGAAGTFAIAGHRTTYGAPFSRLNELAKGDEIRVRTSIATYTYKVTGIKIVKPTQVEVLRDVKGANGKVKSQIVLTTCHPKFTARERLIVFGELSSTKPSTGTVAA